LGLLVSSGPAGARDDALMDALWPDAEGDAARRALATAVFRLRRMLGAEELILRRDGTTGLDPSRCWVDVWALHRLLQRAAGAGEERNSDEWVRSVERAMSLYDATGGGAARPDLEHVRRRLLREALRLGACLESRGETRK